MNTVAQQDTLQHGTGLSPTPPSGWRQTLSARWQHRVNHWVKKRIPPSRHVVLTMHNIFIIPNKQGLGFLLVLALMFVGAINYEANLAFALVFWLLGVFILSIFYTFRNLAGLNLSAVTGGSVFAGEHAEITVILSRHGERIHEAIDMKFPGSRKVTANLIENMEERSALFLVAEHRGWYSPGRLTIETIFPFGICRSWSLVDLDIRCLVYPAPVPCDLNWLTSQQQDSGHTNITRGTDDFHSLRDYQQGDSLRHVAWKIVARGRGMYTKQYASNVDDKIWLKWDMFPDMTMEERLSRICYCVLQLDAGGLDYGLDMPGVKISPAKGSVHYAHVMETLALYGIDTPANDSGETA